MLKDLFVSYVAIEEHSFGDNPSGIQYRTHSIILYSSLIEARRALQYVSIAKDKSLHCLTLILAPNDAQYSTIIIVVL